MEERVEFRSAGLKLAGILHRPSGAKPGERRPAVLMFYGFRQQQDERQLHRALQDARRVGLRRAALRFPRLRRERRPAEAASSVSRRSRMLRVRSPISRRGPTSTARASEPAARASAPRSRRPDRRRRRTRGRGHLEWRLGRRRDQVPPPARLPGGLVACAHDGGRPACQEGGPHHDGAALRHRADPAASADRLAHNSIMEFPFDTVESMYEFRANEVVERSRRCCCCCCTARTTARRRPSNRFACSSMRASRRTSISSPRPTISMSSQEIRGSSPWSAPGWRNTSPRASETWRRRRSSRPSSSSASPPRSSATPA